VIPTVLALGLLVGRWWLVPVAGLAWVLLVALTSALGIGDVPVAAALAMANAAVGVAFHKLVALSLRYLRRQPV
jgi:hypothetical protein